MTYRRLERLILVLSTLVLVAVWLFSLTSIPSISFYGARGGAFHAGVYFGTVGFSFDPDARGRKWFKAQRMPFSNYPPESFDRYKLGGGFLFRKFDDGSPEPIYMVAMPLWVPYLAFLGGVAILIPRLRKRSGAMRERSLAEQAAAGGKPPGAEPMNPQALP